MKLCKNCKKRIPDEKKASAEYCSGACKTIFNRKKNGIPEPDFLGFSKPMNVTNHQRNLLSPDQRHEHRIFHAEIENIQNLYDELLLRYKEYDRIQRDFELSGRLPQEYRVYFNRKKPKKPSFNESPPHPAVIIPNPLPDLSKIVIWKYGHVPNEKGKVVFTRWLDEYKIDKEKERIRNNYEEIEAKNISRIDKYNNDLSIYNEKVDIYNEQFEIYEEYVTHAHKDNGIYLGIRELRKKIEGVKELLQNYTDEIKTRKQIIQESYSEIDAQQHEVLEQPPISVRLTGKDIAQMKFISYKFSPEWADLLGQPSKPFDIMIYGDAKAGKSYFAMMFAQYLTSFGDVAYFAVEEGLSATTQTKIEATGAQDIFLHQSTTIEEVTEELKDEKYKFAFIDSVSSLNMITDDFQALRNQFPETSFVLIMHTTKTGEFAGEKKWKHDVQAILEVRKIGLRTTKIECIGRFGAGEKIIEY